MKLSKFLFPILSLSLLTACHHDNVLLKKPRDEVAKVVFKGEMYAAQKFNLLIDDSTYFQCARDNFYLNPFNHPDKKNNQCLKFFAMMLKAIHRNPAYHAVTVDDLNNMTLAAEIRSQLDRMEIEVQGSGQHSFLR